MRTEKEYLEYLLRCCNNICESERMKEDFGMIPPMLQLFKMRQEIEVRLEGM